MLEFICRIFKRISLEKSKKLKLTTNSKANESVVEILDIVKTGQPSELPSDLLLQSEDYQTPISYPALIQSLSFYPPIFTENIIRRDKGLLEDYFFDFAINEFSEYFKNDVVITLSHFSITPDFAYLDLENKIFIAIEIDEPYSITSTGTYVPIHYVGIDDKRNHELIKNGWSVIRFSEEQIARWPLACVEFIKQYLNNKDHSSLKPIKCWSYAEAQQMISDKYRNTYLPIGFRGILKTQTKFSYRRFHVMGISFMLSKENEKYMKIDLAQYKRIVNHAIESDNWYSCWIKEEVFWKSIDSSTVERLFREPNKHNRDENLFWFALSKFEGYGNISGRYFNLYSPDEFKFIFEETLIRFIDTADFKKSHSKLLADYMIMVKQGREAASSNKN